MRLTLEIAVTTPEEAVAAVRAGADRLELAAALELGGLTPSQGIFGRVRERVDVPVWVLCRPRPGGFLYTPEEVEVIGRDARSFIDAGADGIVVGALDETGGVAKEPCRFVAELARGRVAFHRAFDFVADPSDALEQLVGLGFARILTSGAKPTALEGAASIANLIRKAAGRIEILPGGGIKPVNVAQLVRATGCNQVHAAARAARVDRSLLRLPDLAAAMGAPNSNACGTDAEVVAGLRRELDRLPSLP